MTREALTRGAVPRYNVGMKYVAFVISLILFVGGLYVFSLAFSVVGWEGLVVFAGIVLVGLAYAIPVHILKRVAP